MTKSKLLNNLMQYFMFWEIKECERLPLCLVKTESVRLAEVTQASPELCNSEGVQVT